MIGQRAGDGDALLFAAGELRRPMGQPLAQAQLAQKARGFRPRLRRFGLAGDELRHHDIFERAEFRQEMMGLIDKADAIAADAACARRRQADAADTPSMRISPLGRRFQQSRDMQQRGFARARLADQGHDLAARNATG